MIVELFLLLFSSTGRVAARYLQHDLPDEVMFYIFSFLKELDLCNAAQVCRRFRSISNDHELWYEYLLHLVFWHLVYIYIL